MSRPRPRWPIVLVVWTAFVWTTRIRNIVGDEELSSADRLRGFALSGSFTVLAAVVAWAWFRRAPWLGRAVNALAAWTVGVWIVRVIGIAGADHEVGFVVVHAVLGIVSTALAAVACRHHGPADQRHREVVEQPRRAAVRDQPSPLGDGA